MELKQKLSTVETLCTTADCWSSRRRSFLGVTVHWIDESTLERKGCCLAIRHITGRHTYDIIAKELEAIHQEFGINEKICFTVTDSGSNFLKAFRHFTLEEAEEMAPSPAGETEMKMKKNKMMKIWNMKKLMIF